MEVMGDEARVLAINGGSSSIKFGVFRMGSVPERLLKGEVERIGMPGTRLTVDGTTMPITAADHGRGADRLTDWVEEWNGPRGFAGIGHRVVHGGTELTDHQVITEGLVAELDRVRNLDLAHLPREIALIEAFRRRFPAVPQVACFDTAFHRGMPRVAQLLPIPRRYLDEGIRRLGFHGLSYQYLMEELRRVDGKAAEGRVILAHLGSGASLAAVREGRPVDTSMAFTPTSGLVMGTRPGDVDPGLLVYLMRAEKVTPEEMDAMISHECGLAGVSGTTADVRDLLARRATDERAGEALDLFCYQAKKWIGAYAAALGGLDAVVFTGGIGERSPEMRAGICEGLEFLGVEVNGEKNAASAAVISAAGSRVTVRVIPTDEEQMVARVTCDVISKASL